MCDRKELKAKGKIAFQTNYWKSVLAAFLVVVLSLGGLSLIKGKTGGLNLNEFFRENQQAATSLSPAAGSDAESLDKRNDPDAPQSIDDLPPQLQQYITAPGEGPDLTALAPALLLLLGVLGIVLLVGSATDILVGNPLEIGCKSFFLHNSAAPAKLEEIGAGFRDWGRVVWAMFLKDLFLVLWGFLLLIPGIVKAYSYRLVPYLLIDDPSLTGTAAITLSRKLMRGHKWQAFVLDLSFLGWQILSGLTAGLLGYFYVNPYKQATNAEFYLALREGGTVSPSAPMSYRVPDQPEPNL